MRTRQRTARAARCAGPAERDETGWRRRRTLMTPPDVLSRALAAALLDGEWEPAPMLARLRDTIGAARPWMRALVRATRGTYPSAPADALGALAAWCSTQPAFRAARRERARVLHYATPAPEMAESPWPVPPLATTRELATWIGIDLPALE